MRRGALVVVPVGNTGGRPGPPEYPGAYRHVMTVAALGRDGRVLPLSERGDQVSIAAPGRARALQRRRAARARLVPRTGTSMAAAVVAGAAARVMAARPRLSAQRVRALLEATARDVPPGGVDSASGAGALDLAAALAAPPPPAEDPEPNDDTAQAARSRVLLGGSAASAAVTRADRLLGATRATASASCSARARPSTRPARRPPGRPAPTSTWPSGAPAPPPGSRGSAFARTWLVAASLRPGTDESLAVVAPGERRLHPRGAGAARARPPTG